MSTLPNRTRIEVRSFKWPRRPTSVALTWLLGEDKFGRWLGVRRGDSWWAADHSQAGIFEQPFVKLVPSNTFWTACFHPLDPVIDVDIVLPVQWSEGTLEEVDLELDILCSMNRKVWVRDQVVFDHVRKTWKMPDDIAIQAKTTCEQVFALIEQQTEPFGAVGQTWLVRFLEDHCAHG